MEPSQGVKDWLTVEDSAEVRELLEIEALEELDAIFEATVSGPSDAAEENVQVPEEGEGDVVSEPILASLETLAERFAILEEDAKLEKCSDASSYPRRAKAVLFHARLPKNKRRQTAMTETSGVRGMEGS